MATKLATYDYLNSLSSNDYPVSGNLGKKCVTYLTWWNATGLQTPYWNDLEYIGTTTNTVTRYKVTTTSDWKKADPTSGWPEGCTVLAKDGNWNYWALCLMTISNATQTTPGINALAIVLRGDQQDTTPGDASFRVNMRYRDNSGTYTTINQNISYPAGNTIRNLYTSSFYGVYLPGSPGAGIYATASDVYSFFINIT